MPVRASGAPGCRRCCPAGCDPCGHLWQRPARSAKPLPRSRPAARSPPANRAQASTTGQCARPPDRNAVSAPATHRHGGDRSPWRKDAGRQAVALRHFGAVNDMSDRQRGIPRPGEQSGTGQGAVTTRAQVGGHEDPLGQCEFGRRPLRSLRSKDRLCGDERAANCGKSIQSALRTAAAEPRSLLKHQRKHRDRQAAEQPTKETRPCPGKACRPAKLLRGCSR